MVVRQYYYTSYVDKKTGRAGFQIKALSPGITPEQQQKLARLIAYRIPARLDAFAIDTHPLALRYSYEGPGECILLCSQSSGKDEFGRPGNFFAHALLLDPGLFTSIPPIFFWRSAFWQASDSANRISKESLAVLETFDVEPELDSDELWNFLRHEERHMLLYKLLCAVVHSHSTRRRIIIIDTDENVAHWIALVSSLLPPSYRPLLTFATYHHDPYQADYIITGTSDATVFKSTQHDHATFFILDTQNGITSEVDDSSYAQLACQATDEHAYETILLPVFSTYLQRFPPPTVLDEHLDALAHYAAINANTEHKTLTLNERQAVHLALATSTFYDTDSPETVDELLRLEAALRLTLRSDQDAILQRDYQHVIQYCKLWQVALSPIILEECIFRTAHAPATIASLIEMYGETETYNAINSQAYRDWLTTYAGTSTLQVLATVLQNIEPYLTSNAALDLLQTTLIRYDAKITQADYATTLGACFALSNRHYTHASHHSLLQTFLTHAEHHDQINLFWQSYLHTLMSFLESADTVGQGAQWLDYWFSTTPEHFNQAYIPQQFFLKLASMPAISSTRGRSQSALLLNAACETYAWYQVMQESSRKKDFTYGGQQRFSSLHKRLHKKADMTGLPLEQRTPEENIAILFTPEGWHEHYRQCDRLYYALSPAQFWDSYWQHFNKLFSQDDTQTLLAILHFWFEHAYRVLDTRAYMPQAFFLHLLNYMKNIDKVQRFRETLQKLYQHAQDIEESSYSWYPILDKMLRGTL